MSKGRYLDQVRLTDETDVDQVLGGLLPRDCDWATYEVADPAIARPVLPRLPILQQLLAGAASGPVLRSAFREFWRDQPDRLALAVYLGNNFPPDAPVPVLDPGWVAPMRQLALGDPGQPVRRGLIPSTPTKLARLALARTAVYPASVVRRAAAEAYSEHRYRHRGWFYAGHDAFACALVHPEVDAGPMVERYARFTRRERGNRMRHQIHRLIRWARRNGYIPPADAPNAPGDAPCRCAHSDHTAPRTKQEALALARHRDEIEPLLVMADRDTDKRLEIFECGHCGRFWAGDSLTSGHMTLSFVYPVETDHTGASGWLHKAESLGW